MEARFACGSMVLSILFHKKIHIVNFFVKKIWFLPPGRRRYLPPNAGSPDTYQHWPFRGFRSCRGVRGPNTDRVTPVKYASVSLLDGHEVEDGRRGMTQGVADKYHQGIAGVPKPGTIFKR
jgi:hypothetical protein